MAAPSTRLDHIGIVAADLPAAAASYERLGFRLTPLAQQSGPVEIGGPVERWGSGNRCAMLRRGYLEMIGIVEPGRFDNGLGAFLRRYAGIHILAFGVDDAEAELARLRGAGLDVPGIRLMQRPAATPAGDRLARFKRLPLRDASEGRIQLIEHETPELLWQTHLLDHPNRAVALVDTVLCVADLAATADRFARLTGAAAQADGDTLILPLAAGRLVLCDPRSLPSWLAGAEPPTLPWFAGFSVATADANAAIAGLLKQRGVVHHRAGAGLVVPAAEACGAACRFFWN